MTLKIKVKQIIVTKLYNRQFYIKRITELQGSFVDEGPGIFPDPDLGDSKRPDPQHFSVHCS